MMPTNKQLFRFYFAAENKDGMIMFNNDGGGTSFRTPSYYNHPLLDLILCFLFHKSTCPKSLST